MISVWHANHASGAEEAAAMAARCWPFPVVIESVEGIPASELEQIQKRASAGCVENTIDNYRSSIRGYLMVAAELGVENPFPLTEAIVLRWLNWHGQKKRVSHQSLKSYWCGISRCHADGTGRPFVKTRAIRDSLRSYARDSTLNKTIDDVRQIFSSETIGRLINLYFASSADGTAQITFAQTAAVTLATVTWLRACQVWAMTPRNCSFGQSDLLGQTFTYVIPALKNMCPSSSDIKTRIISRGPHFNIRLGDYFRVLEELWQCTKHEPDTPMLVTLGLKPPSSASDTLGTIIKQCFPLVGAETTKVTAHSTRKTGAAEAIAMGVDLATVSRFGGWQSQESVRPYTNLAVTPTRSSYHFFGHLDRDLRMLHY